MRSWRHICINIQSSLINYLYKNIRTADIQYAELMENLLLYGFECDFLFAFYSTEKLSDEIDFILVSFFSFSNSADLKFSTSSRIMHIDNQP